MPVKTGRRVARGAGGGLLRRHRDFRQLWYGETAGKFGVSVTGVLLPLAAVSVLHAGTFAVSLLNVATWLPWLVIGLPAGVWVDRLRRRTVMLVCDAVSCALFLSVPVAAWCGVLGIGQLLLVALLVGSAAVFFQTAYTAYLPTLLSSPDQAEGNAKLHGSAAAAQIAGVGSGGLIAQAAGAVDGMLTNAATFLISFLCIGRIRHREPPAAGSRSGRRAPLLGDLREGVRLVARDPYLRSLTLFGGASNLALGGCQALLVVFLARDIGLSSGAVGALVGLGGAGGVLGALLVRRGAARLGTARALLLFELGVPALAPLMALTRDGAGLVFFVVGYGAAALGVVAGNIIKAGFIQGYCPSGVLGRVTACSAFVNYGTLPLGALLAGGLGTLLGVRPTMWLLTAAMPLAALILLWSPIRSRRDLPAREADPS